MPNQILDDNSLEITKSPVVELSQAEQDLNRIWFLVRFLFVCHILSFLFLRIYYNQEFIEYINHYKKSSDPLHYQMAAIMIEAVYLVLSLFVSLVIILISVKSQRKAVLEDFIEECKTTGKIIYPIIFLLAIGFGMIISFFAIGLIGVITTFTIVILYEIIHLLTYLISFGYINLDCHQLEADLSFMILSVAFFYYLYRSRTKPIEFWN